LPTFHPAPHFLPKKVSMNNLRRTAMWDVTFVRARESREAVVLARKTKPGAVVVSEVEDSRAVAFGVDLSPAGLEMTPSAMRELLSEWERITGGGAVSATGGTGRKNCFLLAVPSRKAKQMRRVFRRVLSDETNFEFSAALEAKAREVPVA
jgi:hypothetical protein